jgi:hypothetical protein
MSFAQAHHSFPQMRIRGDSSRQGDRERSFVGKQLFEPYGYSIYQRLGEGRSYVRFEFSQNREKEKLQYGEHGLD